MDSFKFDAATRLFSSGMTRRETLRSLLAGAAAVTAGSVLVSSQDAAAKRRRRKNRKKGEPEGSPCKKDGECRASRKLICEIPFGASNSDKACCRGEGATCNASQHCCTGEAGGREFQCVNGTCQPFVEEP